MAVSVLLSVHGKSQKLHMERKVRTFKSNAPEMNAGKSSKTILNKLNSSQTKCLRRIREMFWLSNIRTRHFAGRNANEGIKFDY